MDKAIQISLTDEELASLVSVMGVDLNQLSPALELAGLPGSMGPDCRSELITAGVLEADRAALTQHGHDLLARLLRPQTRLGICAGTTDWLATTVSVAAGDLRGHEAMVSIGRDDDGWAISWPQPAAELVAMLQDHFTGPVLNSPVPFAHTLPPSTYCAFLGVLDHLLSQQLQSTLDRVPVVAEPFGARDVWHQVSEGRTGSNLTWQTTVSRVLFPDLELGVDETATETGLEDLAGQGILFLDDEGGYLPSESLLALTEGLIPVFRFGGVRVDRLVAPDVVETTHVALRSGLGAILQEEVIEDGVNVRSIGSIQLEDLILNFRFPESAESSTDRSVADAPAGRSFCSQCGAPVQSESIFCVKCGHRLKAEGAP